MGPHVTVRACERVSEQTLTLSTTEAEYVAATHAAKEAVWLHRLFGELFPPITNPTTLHGDNKSAIALATGGQFHARTKHIDIHGRHLADQSARDVS
jgi:hypothetical protein